MEFRSMQLSLAPSSEGLDPWCLHKRDSVGMDQCHQASLFPVFLQAKQCTVSLYKVQKNSTLIVSRHTSIHMKMFSQALWVISLNSQAGSISCSSLSSHTLVNQIFKKLLDTYLQMNKSKSQGSMAQLCIESPEELYQNCRHHHS